MRAMTLKLSLIQSTRLYYFISYIQAICMHIKNKPQKLFIKIVFIFMNSLLTSHRKSAIIITTG